MIGLLRLDRTVLFGVYRRMLTIQDVWLECRARDLSREGKVTQQGEQVLPEEQALFTDLVFKLKRMVVASR